MPNPRYVWRIFCVTENQYVSTISETQPTVCPNNAGHTIDTTTITVMESIFTDIISEGYVNIESQLSDNQALKISASDTNGGIDIDAGAGGITVDTTNALSLDAGAASNFTTTSGNLDLIATVGVTNAYGGGGMNIGNSGTSTSINIGSESVVKTITMGNQTSTSSTNIYSGTGGITQNSATGKLQLASTNTSVDAVRIDTSGAAGGIFLAAGSNGISIGNDGVAHTIVVGNTTGASALIMQSGTGTISIGNDGVAKTINIGQFTGATALTLYGGSGNVDINSTGYSVISANTGVNVGNTAGTVVNIGNTSTTTAINIDSGTGGITIGNNSANGGEIHIGNVAFDKTLIIGNSTGATRLFNRFGTGGYIKHQEAHVALSDADTTLTIANLLTAIMSGTPTTTRTLTLPTAALAVAGISGVQVGDAIDFSIINKAGASVYSVAAGSGGSIEGNTTISASSSALYRMRFTNVSGGTEAYVTYRVT